jgi:radical SAM protein with 4Fe4S-binding SPASM domain
VGKIFPFKIKSAALVVTKRCNLNCRWCFEQPDKPSPSKQELLTLMEKLKTAEMLVVTGGEPFAREDIKEILAEAAKRFSKVHLTTNGTLLTEADVAFLASQGINATVSLDGLKALQDKLRGQGTFEKVVKTVKRMVKAGVKVNLQMTVSKLNCKDARGVIELGEALGVQRVSLLPMKRIGRGSSFDKKCLSQKARKKIIERIEALKAGWKTEVVFKSSFANLYNQDLTSLAASVDRETICGGCKAGIAGIFVEWNGDVYPCPFLRVKIGNLFQQDLKEVWEGSEVLNKLREKESIKGCSSCKYWQVCRGCRADALAASGDFLGEDPYCWAKKEVKTECESCKKG